MSILDNVMHVTRITQPGVDLVVVVSDSYPLGYTVIDMYAHHKAVHTLKVLKELGEITED